MINKLYSKLSGNKYSKAISVALYIFMIIGLIVGYVFSLKYYKSFNFIITEGVLKRGLIMLPLVISMIYMCVRVIPYNIKRLSYLYWYLFVILSLIPIPIVYTLNGIGSSKNIVAFIYLVGFICISGIYLIDKLDIKIPSIKLSKKSFWILIIAFIVFAYGYIIYKLGSPSRISLAFTDVYSVRLNYREMGGKFVDYFVQWLGNIINPFILCYLIYKKKYKLIFIPIALELVLYGYTAYKSLLVTMIVVPFIAEVLRRGVPKLLIEFLATAGIFGGIVFGYLGKLSLYLFIVIRVFLWPSLIALEYYDFFWMYPKVKLSHSIFGGFFQNIYNLEPSLYMGRVYYSKPDMRLNVTWYGDAYMNFGYLGVIIFAIMLLCIMLIIKSVEKKNVYLVSSLLFGGLMTLFNGPLLTTLLTGGLGLGLVLAYLLPEEV